MAVLREYNIHRHSDTHLKDKFHSLQGQLRKDKINDMLAGLKKRQYALTRSRDVSEGAVRASYQIANELEQASKPFYDCELMKICEMKAVEVEYPEKQSPFANIRLARNTFAHRVEELSRKLGSQINDKIKSFIAFWVAIVENNESKMCCL